MDVEHQQTTIFLLKKTLDELIENPVSHKLDLVYSLQSKWEKKTHNTDNNAILNNFG